MLELWGMRSTPSLPSLPDPLWPGVVAPDRVLSMGQMIPYQIGLGGKFDNYFIHTSVEVSELPVLST